MVIRTLFFSAPMLCLFFLALVTSTSAEKINAQLEQPLALEDTSLIKDLLLEVPSPLTIDLNHAKEVLTKADSLLSIFQLQFDSPFTPIESEITYLIGLLAYFEGEYDVGIKRFEKLFSSNEIEKINHKLPKLYGNWGILEELNGNLYRARWCHSKALEYSKDSAKMAIIKNNLGLVAFKQGASIEAAHLFQEAIAHYDLNIISQKKGAADAYLNWGIVFMEIDSLERGLSSFQYSLQLALESGHAYVIPRAYQNIAIYYFVKEEPEIALQYLDSAFYWGQRNEDYYLVVNTHLEKARYLFMDKNDFELAKQEYNLVNQLLKEYSFQAEYIDYYQSLSLFYEKYSQPDSAKILLQQALLLSIEYGDSYNEMDCIKRLAEIEESEGNYEAAFNYIIRHEQLADSIHRTQMQIRIDDISSLHRLENLEKEKQVLSGHLLLEKSRTQRTSILFFGGVAAFLITLTILVWVMKQKKLEKNLFMIVKMQSQKQKNLLQENTLITKLITHDIRGPLIQIQTIVANLISSVKDQNLIPQFERIYSSTLQIHHLSRQLLNQETELEMLNTDSKKWEDPNENLNNVIQVHLHAAAYKKIDLKYRPIDHPEKLYVNHEALHLILGNLLSNAIKYSPIHESIDISIIEHLDSYEFLIRDRGPGFQKTDFQFMFNKFQSLSAKPTAGESSQGIGLFLAKKLSWQIGGELNISNHPDKGAIASLKISKTPISLAV